jgi:hypothetical protein
MTAIPMLNKILADALRDMLALSGSGAIAARAQQADQALMNTVVPENEYAYRAECMNKLSDMQWDIAAGQRSAALAALVATTQNISLATQKMDQAAAANILLQVASAGSAAANTVTSVAAVVAALGVELKKVGEGAPTLDSAGLSAKINDALDGLNGLKNM